VVVGGNGITRTLLLKLIKKHLSHSQHYHVSLKAFFLHLSKEQWRFMDSLSATSAT
jgi:hypothetical protein